MGGKIKLLQTVKALHDEGKTKLSNSELRQIEAETRDLLAHAHSHRTAKAAPEGFDELLRELEGLSPDEAYDAVVSFLDAHGEVETRGEEAVEDLHEDKERGIIEDLDESVDDLKESEEKEERMEELQEKDKEKGKEKDKEKGKEKKKNKDSKDDKDGKSEKEDILDKAGQMQEKDQKEKNMKLKQKKDRDKDCPPDTMAEMGVEEEIVDPIIASRAKQTKVVVTKQGNITAHNLDLGKPVFYITVPKNIKKNANKLRRLANKVYGWIVYEGWNKAAKRSNAFVLTGGVDDDIETDHAETPEKANKGVTEEAEDNIRQDKETPSEDVLNDYDTNSEQKPESVSAARRRIRNRIKQRIARKRKAQETSDEARIDALLEEANLGYNSQGPASSIMAEVRQAGPGMRIVRFWDDNAEAFVEYKYAVDVLEEVASETSGEDAEDAYAAFWGKLPVDEIDRDAWEKLGKARRIKQRIAKRKRSKGILDDSEGTNIANEDAQKKPPKDSGEGADNSTRDEQPTKKHRDVLSDGDVNFKEAADNYSKLYASRAKKAAEGAVKDFVEKFQRCIHIASMRMKLNHDESPFKIASADVLTSDDVQFSDGDYYQPMETKIAVELTELISSEGHDQFVGRLLKAASDLLEKSDEYLEDVESDIENLSPAPVEVDDGEEPKTSVRKKSNKRRSALKRGNMELSGAPVAPPQGIVTGNSIRSALADGTSVGRRVARLAPKE